MKIIKYIFPEYVSGMSFQSAQNSFIEAENNFFICKHMCGQEEKQSARVATRSDNKFPMIDDSVNNVQNVDKAKQIVTI